MIRAHTADAIRAAEQPLLAAGAPLMQRAAAALAVVQARLLRESPLPLVRIAGECGFSSQSALTTAMRRYMGLTPKRLRGLQ